MDWHRVHGIVQPAVKLHAVGVVVDEGSHHSYHNCKARISGGATWRKVTCLRGAGSRGGVTGIYVRADGSFGDRRYETQ